MTTYRIFAAFALVFGVIFSIPAAAQMTWNEIHPPRSGVQSLVVTQNGAALAFDDSTLYRSNDGGNTWRENTAGFPQHKGTGVACITEDVAGNIWVALQNSNNLIFLSDDDGLTFSPVPFAVEGLKGNLAALFYVQGRYFGSFRYQVAGRDTTRAVMCAGEMPTDFSLLDAPQSIDLMASGGLLFGRTVEKTPGFTDKYLLWEYSPATGQWAKIFTPNYDGNGNYPFPKHILALPSGERFIAATIGAFVRQNFYYSPDAGKTWEMLFQTKFGNEEKMLNALVALDDEHVAMIFDFHTDTNIDTMLVKSNGKWVLAPLTNLQNRSVQRTAGPDAAGNLYIHSNTVLKLAPDRKRWIDCGLPGRFDANEQAYVSPDSRIFVRHRSGMMQRSDDDGKTWRALTDNLPRKSEALAVADYVVVADDGTVYVRMDNTLLASADAGATWNEVKTDVSSIIALYPDRTRIFVAGRESLREISGGIAAAIIRHPFGNAAADSIGFFMKLRNGSHLLRVGRSNEFRISADGGQTWTNAVFTKFPMQYETLTDPVEMPDGVLYAIFRYNIFDGKSIYRSSDGGATWDRTAFARVFHEDADNFMLDHTGIPHVIDGTNGVVRLTPYFDGAINLGLKLFGLRGLRFNGKNEPYAYDWAAIYKGTPAPDAMNWERTGSLYVPSGDKRIIAIASKTNNDVWIASLQAGVLRSVDNGSFWSSRALAAGILNTKLFIDSRNVVFACTNNGVYRCVDGYTWQESANGIPLPMFVYEMLEDTAGIFYAATFGDGVYRSTDRGDNWDKFSDGIRNDFTRGLAIDPDGIIYVATNGGVYALDNGAAKWREISGNLGNLISGGEIETAFGNVYCHTDMQLQSAKSGSPQWQSELPEAVVHSLYRERTGRLIACTKDGLWRKSSSEGAWERFGFAGREVFAIGENATYYFAGLDDQQVYRLSKGFAGAEESVVAESFAIFPNPSVEYIALTLPASAAELVIVNALGETVARYDLPASAGHFRCWVDGLPAGVYSVRVSGRNGTQAGLFVRQ